MEKFKITKKGNNFKALLKDGYEVLGTFGKDGVILGKGLHRIMFDVEIDEATFSYILNK